MATPQVNIRVPEDARETLLRVGARLRSDPAFATQLRRFMDVIDDPTAIKPLSERVGVLEDRVNDLAAKLEGNELSEVADPRERVPGSQ